MKFIKRVLVAAKDKVVSFVKDAYHHAEAAALLVAASFGINAAVSTLTTTEAGKFFILPAFLEPTMVIPVVSVLAVIALVKLGEYRTYKRTPALKYV